MSSNSNGDGRFSIGVTFDIGTNLDIAQVQVQNRVATALPRLPADVRNIGVTVAKASTDLMMVVHLLSPDKSRDALFISNYAMLEIKDALTRVDGVGSIIVFGSRDYSMRVWLDPDAPAIARHDRDRRHARAAGPEHPGRLRHPQPAAGRQAGRVPDRGADARPARRSRAVRQCRGQADAERRGAAQGHRRASSSPAQDYSSNSYLDLDPAVAIAVFQRPGSNALATAQAIRKTMAEAAKRFPAGLEYTIVYDPTQFIQQSVDAVHGDDPRGDPAGRPGRRAVPADLARRDHSAGRHPGVADRHLLPDGDVRLLAEQPVAVRPGARGRHRGRRRHRRGRERRAQHRGGA